MGKRGQIPTWDKANLATAEEIEWQNMWVPTEAVTGWVGGFQLLRSRSWGFGLGERKMWKILRYIWGGVERRIGRTRGFLGQCGSPGGSRNGPCTSLNISSNTQNVRRQERTHTWIVVFGWWWHVPVASSVVTNGPFRGRVVTLREVDGRSLYFAFSFTMILKLL